MNRVAAQNARDRRKNYVEDLEKRVALLEQQVFIMVCSLMLSLSGEDLSVCFCVLRTNSCSRRTNH